MIISLIGMSSAGKTHWARKLESKGFIRFTCDEHNGGKKNPQRDVIPGVANAYYSYYNCIS